MRRREGWECVVSSGKKARVKATGRKMHCGLCMKEGRKRDKCPVKDEESIPPEEQEVEPNNGMKFMPTPSLRQQTSTGCTPLASTPPSVPIKAKKKTPRKSVKFFAPPRPKKK
ncbi:hypothetical protein POM88_048828 [Heracleum sosnowskyi]|uniref:Uncharacterized protein n=1 Tax=Heracleum sosnowskyi TaxID=360622 RepID=A0AAD8GWL3_9APIA|nr:hypothetical protein POM88_048828 [Heracleum sosnowskyi]